MNEPVTQDAERWGTRLNDASWAVIEAWNPELMGPMTGGIFNNMKSLVRIAILKYLEPWTEKSSCAGLTDEEVNALMEYYEHRTH
jgi:hypothetical protein